MREGQLALGVASCVNKARIRQTGSVYQHSWFLKHSKIHKMFVCGVINRLGSRAKKLKILEHPKDANADLLSHTPAIKQTSAVFTVVARCNVL